MRVNSYLECWSIFHLRILLASTTKVTFCIMPNREPIYLSSHTALIHSSMIRSGSRLAKFSTRTLNSSGESRSSALYPYNTWTSASGCTCVYARVNMCVYMCVYVCVCECVCVYRVVGSTLSPFKRAKKSVRSFKINEHTNDSLERAPTFYPYLY